MPRRSARTHENQRTREVHESTLRTSVNNALSTFVELNLYIHSQCGVLEVLEVELLEELFIYIRILKFLMHTASVF